MRIDASGFVGAQAGSVASANAVILRSLLSRNHRVRFFTKPSFVDPRDIELSPQEASNLKVIDCTNWRTDGIRSRTERMPLVNRLTGWLDVRTYNCGLVRKMRSLNLQGEQSQVMLWLGDYARGRIHGVPSVSYLQGPPATDARSILRHRSLIVRLAGQSCYLKLRAYAMWRMGLGYPDLLLSDELIVGSEWSRQDLISAKGANPLHVHAIPYPIDLVQFRPSERPREISGPLRLLWLGRFVPRKRLDLFLDGMELAIRRGCDVTALVIGCSGFVPNYERLLKEFPYPDRLEQLQRIDRGAVPEILGNVDVMVQPSDHENFGSSVAEALACGVPVIVGATNGTSDYICGRSVRLQDDNSETMADAIAEMSARKLRGELQDRQPSRKVAEKHFDKDIVVDKLMQVLQSASENYSH